MDAEQGKMLAAAREGNQIALQQLLVSRYEHLAGLIRPQIPRPLQSTVDVEDILQTTFVQVFRGLSHFKEGDTKDFDAWVRSIAEAKLKDTIRRATRKKRGGDLRRKENPAPNTSESIQDLILLLSDQRRSPSQSAATHQAIAALRIALAGLPEDQREAIWLRHIEGLTIEEVVQTMGRSEGAVRGLLHRGKASLKQAMGHSSTWFSRT